MIDDVNLLQIDSTVIAGVLILLTIGHFRNERQYRNRPPQSYRYAALIIVPFAISAMSILVMNMMIIADTTIPLSSPKSIPTWLTFSGFFYLAFVMCVLFSRRETGISFEIKQTYWYPPEKQINSVFYTILISGLLKNTTEQDTVINTISISFRYKNQDYSIDSSFNEIKMESGDSKMQNFTFNINENRIQITDDRIINITLRIQHTRDMIEKIIPFIEKHEYN